MIRTARQTKAHEYYTTRKAYNSWIVGEHLANGCAACGELELALLEFHHKDPSMKIRPVKSYLGRSTKLLEEELTKCIVLCKDCHAEVHYKSYN